MISPKPPLGSNSSPLSCSASQPTEAFFLRRRKMKLTEFISDVGKPIAYYPNLKRITGSTVATIFLCQFIYWTGKQRDDEGWIYKTQSEIEQETGLTRTEQETARRILSKKGFLEHKYKGIPRQLYYRINIDAINEAWETVHTIMQDSCKQA